MNGTENSNMVKIDAALGEKANSSVAINTTLLASAWVGVDAPYTQTLTISGLTASQNGTISVAHNATAEQREIAREAMLSVTEPIACGCISDYDLNLLGFSEDAESNGAGYQRKGCMCYAGKTELLKHKTRCPHGCLYCYWKDIRG